MYLSIEINYLIRTLTTAFRRIKNLILLLAFLFRNMAFTAAFRMFCDIHPSTMLFLRHSVCETNRYLQIYHLCRHTGLFSITPGFVTSFHHNPIRNHLKKCYMSHFSLKKKKKYKENYLPQYSNAQNINALPCLLIYI